MGSLTGHRFLTIEIFLPYLQTVHTEVVDHRPVILEIVHSAEQFLRDHRDRLAPELQNKLKNMTNDLRGSYEGVSLKSTEWLDEAQEVLEILKAQEEEQVAVDSKLEDVTQAIEYDLDWVRETEKRLAMEQPIAEQSRVLREQQDEHKVNIFGIIYLSKL